MLETSDHTDTMSNPSMRIQALPIPMVDKKLNYLDLAVVCLEYEPGSI